MNPGSAPALTQAQRTAPASAHRCKRLRHRQSECRRCIDVCPEGAITLDPGPTVSERCTRCGLCQTACPTEVFQGEVHTDQRLLSGLGPSLGGDRGAGAGPALFVHCREAEPSRRESVAVPCLGSVTGNFLLGAAALGAKSLTLVRGDCDRCRLRAGEALFATAKATYLALAPVVGLDRCAVRVEQQQRRDRAVAARRKFLARVTGLGAAAASDWPAPVGEAHDPSSAPCDAGTGSTPGRALLRRLLNGASWSSAPSLSFDPQLPWASLRIDQRDCATCGTCVNLCPTGAITRSIGNDRLSHHFSSALCINCGLCREACPQQVIGFDPEVDARDLVQNEARAITDIALHACAICGETLPEREGRFCITCQRRGRVASYIPAATAGR